MCEPGGIFVKHLDSSNLYGCWSRRKGKDESGWNNFIGSGLIGRQSWKHVLMLIDGAALFVIESLLSYSGIDE